MQPIGEPVVPSSTTAPPPTLRTAASADAAALPTAIPIVTPTASAPEPAAEPDSVALGIAAAHSPALEPAKAQQPSSFPALKPKPSTPVLSTQPQLPPPTLRRRASTRSSAAAPPDGTSTLVALAANPFESAAGGPWRAKLTGLQREHPPIRERTQAFGGGKFKLSACQAHCGVIIASKLGRSRHTSACHLCASSSLWYALPVTGEEEISLNQSSDQLGATGWSTVRHLLWARHTVQSSEGRALRQLSDSQLADRANGETSSSGSDRHVKPLHSKRTSREAGLSRLPAIPDSLEDSDSSNDDDSDRSDGSTPNPSA
jgi:hypothetical protein